MRPTASRVEASFYVDRELSHSINKGDVLNVYRKKRLSRQIRIPFGSIGILLITASQETSAIGVFEPNASVMPSGDQAQDGHEGGHCRASE